jgi:hypothetical protein
MMSWNNQIIASNVPSEVKMLTNKMDDIIIEYLEPLMSNKVKNTGHYFAVLLCAIGYICQKFFNSVEFESEDDKLEVLNHYLDSIKESVIKGSS